MELGYGGLEINSRSSHILPHFTQIKKALLFSYGCTQRCIISMFPHLSRVSISLQEFQGSSTTIERATFTLIHMNLILTMYPTELMKYIFAVDV